MASKDLSMSAADQQPEVEKLASVEETSAKYLNELVKQILDLRQKLSEEKLINRELGLIKCSLQGRIEVHCQRIDELGVDRARDVMGKVKEEMQRANEEAIDLSRDILATSLGNLKTIEKSSLALEDLRLQYKEPAIKNQLSFELQREKKLKLKIKELGERMESKKKEVRNLSSSIQIFDGADAIKNQLVEDVKKTRQEIRVLNNKIFIV